MHWLSLFLLEGHTEGLARLNLLAICVESHSVGTGQQSDYSSLSIWKPKSALYILITAIVESPVTVNNIATNDSKNMDPINGTEMQAQLSGQGRRKAAYTKPVRVILAVICDPELRPTCYSRY